MKQISEFLFERGKQGIKYVRRRIPSDLRLAYPQNKVDITRSLGTSDLREAKAKLRIELTKIDAEFAQAREQIKLSRAWKNAKRIRKLSDEQLQSTAQYWARQVLLADDLRRQSGLDDEEFDELGQELAQQRQEFGRMLAQGNTQPVFPALWGFLHLCGLDFNPDEAESKRATYVFLRTIVETLDHQLARHQGTPVTTDSVSSEVPHPLRVIAPERAPASESLPTWEKVFDTWRDHVEDRPKATTISSQTPWRDLKRFMQEKGRAASPAQITALDMTEFVHAMKERGLAVETINERLSKIRAIFKIACGKHVLAVNPAADTLGFKESGAKKRRKKRLPFDRNDLQQIFGSEVFIKHKRSQGQAGEASYWIPLLMFYTGARPEEVAGLALCDLRQDAQHGWYFSIVDKPSDEDDDLFDENIPASHRRILKNAQSVRQVPVAPQLIELGLLRYVEWLRAKGDTVLFPTLQRDWHEKLSGAFSKFFGRYKHAIGIDNKRKVLYSFRHTMKDLLEAANVPSKYLQRLLGHATGDGAITDGYGSDLPIDLLAEHFSHIHFPDIPALPWEPGKGFVSFKRIKSAR
jgi:integrase